MTARSKPLQVLEATENDAATRAAKFVKPAAKSAVKLVDSVDELVHLLHNEAKAI
jgi:electron transfer flavoprotein beta subunit